MSFHTFQRYENKVWKLTGKMGMKTCWSNCLKGNFGPKTSMGMKMYEKGMKTPYLKVPWRSCVIIGPGLPPTGYENQCQFSYSPQTDLGFHTLGRQSLHNDNTTFPRHLKVRSFHAFFIRFSYPETSLRQSCLSGNLTSKFPYPFFLLVFVPGSHTSGNVSRETWAVPP